VIRVLIVDDSALVRKILAQELSRYDDIEVVGTAVDPYAARDKIYNLRPDVLTLDIEMPEMTGLEVLEALQSERSTVGAIMLSTLTQKGGEMTMRALELGAFDFIPKPQSGSMAENKNAIRNYLGPMIKAFARNLEVRKTIHRIKLPAASRQKFEKAVSPATLLRKDMQKRSGPSSIIAIGVSTGGPNALARLLPKLPSDIGVPIVIVQHMPPVFTQSLAKSLDAKCAIEVREAIDNEPLKPNVAYIAPGGKQMKLAAGADGRQRIVKITDDPPENSCKPSVDYLFRSVADHYVGRSTGVIMTGMGSDGTAGLKIMKNNGTFVIAQDEASCVVFGMPREPIESGIVDVIAPLDRLAEAIIKTTLSNASIVGAGPGSTSILSLIGNKA